MTQNTNHQSRISLRKAFEKLKKKTSERDIAHSQFMDALGRSKYDGIEIPDEIVDVIDYAQADMTFEEFKERMDEELESMKES